MYDCVYVCKRYLIATEREGTMAVARAERMEGFENLRGFFMACWLASCAALWAISTCSLSL